MTVRVVGFSFTPNRGGGGDIGLSLEHHCSTDIPLVELPAVIEALERIDDITDAMEFLVAYRQFVEELKQLTTPADADGGVK